MMNANLKRTVGQLKSGKLAAKGLKPLIRDLPKQLVERADQVLLGLSHTRDSIPSLLKQTLTRIENNPNDLVGRVGRQVLERAEIVRKQLIEKSEDSDSRVNARWVPDWLKEMSFTPTSQTMNGVPTAAEAAPLKASVRKASVDVVAKSVKPRDAKTLMTKATKASKAPVKSVLKSASKSPSKSPSKSASKSKSAAKV
ncbi:hypothetical protein BH10BDE1_BH10BDE1_10360 [soil metagenome]